MYWEVLVINYTYFTWLSSLLRLKQNQPSYQLFILRLDHYGLLPIMSDQFVVWARVLSYLLLSCL